MGRYLFAATLRLLGVFRLFPGLKARGSFRHPLLRGFRRVNWSQGRITSETTKIWRWSRNSRTGRTSVDLPGPLRWSRR